MKAWPSKDRESEPTIVQQNQAVDALYTVDRGSYWKMKYISQTYLVIPRLLAWISTYTSVASFNWSTISTHWYTFQHTVS